MRKVDEDIQRANAIRNNAIASIQGLHTEVNNLATDNHILRGKLSEALEACKAIYDIYDNLENQVCNSLPAKLTNILDNQIYQAITKAGA